MYLEPCIFLGEFADILLKSLNSELMDLGLTSRLTIRLVELSAEGMDCLQRVVSKAKKRKYIGAFFLELGSGQNGYLRAGGVKPYVPNFIYSVTYPMEA